MSRQITEYSLDRKGEQDSTYESLGIEVTVTFRDNSIHSQDGGEEKKYQIQRAMSPIQGKLTNYVGT